MKKFIQLSLSHPIVMNHLMDQIDSKIAEDLKLLPFQSATKIREHFENFTDLSLLDEEITIIDGVDTHQISTNHAMAYALEHILNEMPDFALQLIKQIPFENFCLYLKTSEDHEINTLLTILPDYYLKPALVLIKKQIAIKFIYKNTQCIKNASLELKKQLIQKMNLKDYRFKLQEFRNLTLKAFTANESDEELEAQVEQFSKKLDLQQPVDKTTPFEVPFEYYDSINCYVIENAIRVPTGQYIDFVTFQSLIRRGDEVQNPFNRNYYPEAAFIDDPEHQEHINAWKKEQNIEILRANNLLQT